MNWKPRFDELDSDVVTVRSEVKAEALLRILNGPKKSETMRKLGWNIEAARIECEKVIAGKKP